MCVDVKFERVCDKMCLVAYQIASVSTAAKNLPVQNVQLLSQTLILETYYLYSGNIIGW